MKASGMKKVQEYVEGLVAQAKLVVASKFAARHSY